MEEDEEIVHKNSGLYACLVEAGFHDFESIDKTDLKFGSMSVQENVESIESFHRNGKYYANLEEYENYIQSCLRSKLVFADDASFVEHYMASSNVSPSGYFIFSTQVVSYSVIGICFNSCHFLRTNIPPILFWSLHVLPLAICGIHFSYRSYQKFRRKAIINRLLSTLKELSLFVQKSVQFVLNRSVLAFISDQSHLNDEESTYLQEILFNTLRSTILELKSATVSFVKDYPLKEAVENHQYYLASLSDEDLHCVHPNERTSPEYLQVLDLGWRYECEENIRTQYFILRHAFQVTEVSSMFSSEERLAKRTPAEGVGRFEYLKQLVNEFATTSVISHKEQILANLANFAYDPINYQFLRSLGVLNLFLDQLNEDNASLVRFAVCGLCNLSTDPENKEYIVKIGGIEAIANCVKISDEQTKLSAITALIFLHGCGNIKIGEDIIHRVKQLTQTSDNRFKNISQIFLEKYCKI